MQTISLENEYKEQDNCKNTLQVSIINVIKKTPCHFTI